MSKIWKWWLLIAGIFAVFAGFDMWLFVKFGAWRKIGNEI